jgi:hypothetical protein
LVCDCRCDLCKFRWYFRKMVGGKERLNLKTCFIVRLLVKRRSFHCCISVDIRKNHAKTFWELMVCNNSTRFIRRILWLPNYCRYEVWEWWNNNKPRSSRNNYGHPSFIRYLFRKHSCNRIPIMIIYSHKIN